MSHKSQINVDLIVSYLLFIVFVGFVISFTIRLTDPFSNYMEISKEDIGMSLLDSMVPKKVDIAEISSICSISMDELMSVKFEYDIVGFEMPEYDFGYVLPNETSGGVLIVRDGNTLDISAYAGTSNKTLSLALQFPEGMNAFIMGVTNETDDDVSIVNDSFGGRMISIEMNVNETDNDEFRIMTHDSGLVLIVSFSGGELYVGPAKKQDYCGRESGGKERTSYGYMIAEKEQRDFVAKYYLTGWWEN